MMRRSDLFSPTADVSSVSSAVCFESMGIIRIWSGASYLEGQVGHVSFEIPSLRLYVSLWPGEPTTVGLFPHIIKPRWHNLADDINAEERDADHVFYLFSLDIEQMRKYYDERKLNIVGWMLQGQSGSVRANTENCTTLVYGVLKAGGIETLVSSTSVCGWQEQGSFAGSSADWIPNRLAVYLPRAVEAERSRYSETTAFEERAKTEGIFDIPDMRIW